MKAVHVLIHGRVQGVWFRASTRDQAAIEGVNGWVRNTSDGSVEVHIEGDSDAVERLVVWCHNGPPGARVDRIDAEEILPQGFKDFKIRY
jgi:acylphosphatase